MSIGVLGLGVMGLNLARNLERNGSSVSVYNRSEDRTHEFMDTYASDGNFTATFSIQQFVDTLSQPRKALLMVKAGDPTDALIDQLLPHLDAGDILMDGGNAHYADTNRRDIRCCEVGVHYLGVGVSGGEVGALEGPSIMVGGSTEAFDVIGPTLESIAATGPQGPCCALLGPNSAGHYVKMVHNGIEYAVMQILSEAYDIMRRGLGMSATAMAAVFHKWNEGELDSYLVEITADILSHTDPDSGKPLVEYILDTASQKGTGKWSSQSALDLGSPSSSISAAVFARVLSSLQAERVTAQHLLEGPDPTVNEDRVLDRLHSAVLLSTLTAYAQGFRQLRDASAEYSYNLDLSEVARVWTAGCIIRAGLLTEMGAAFRNAPDLPFLLLDSTFADRWNRHQRQYREVVSLAQRCGIPTPGMSSALSCMDAYRTGRLPANLLQAQRDYFGAHTYQRTDRLGTFHTDWQRPTTVEEN